MITHRVIIQGVRKGSDPTEIVRENFEVSTDAEAYFAEMQKEGSVANALLATYPVLILTLEEQHLGEWIAKSRLVMIQ